MRDHRPIGEQLDALVQSRTGSTLPPFNAVTFLERYLPFPLSMSWRVVVACAWALGVSLKAEVDALLEVCSFSEPAPGGYSEILVVAGRRSGKSAVIAGLGVFIATVEAAAHMAFLAPGQRGYVVIISRTTRQALEVFRYARAIVERNSELADLLDEEPLESVAGGELRFKNGVVLTVMPASKGSVRGFTVIGAILDEFAWVASDEESANADEEIESAIRFAMLAPIGAPRRRKVIISSPAAKAGVVYEQCLKYHGQPDAPVLVARGPTWVWNPSIDRAVLEAEKLRDPKRYSREVLAEFVDAVSAWCDADIINAAAVGRDATALEPRPRTAYYAAVDMAFRRDSTALAIGHEEHAGKDADDTGPRLIVDAVFRWTPTPGKPLDANMVVREISNIAKRYHVGSIVADQFAFAPLAAAFLREGIGLRELTATSKSKFDNFTRLRERLCRGKVSLPAHDVTLRELRELQERMTSTGNIQIGHPNRATAHDDCASAIAWLCAACDEHPMGAPVSWDEVRASQRGQRQLAADILNRRRNSGRSGGIW